jgi:hypothetical protein
VNNLAGPPILYSAKTLAATVLSTWHPDRRKGTVAPINNLVRVPSQCLQAFQASQVRRKDPSARISKLIRGRSSTSRRVRFGQVRRKYSRIIVVKLTEAERPAPQTPVQR